MAKRLGSSSGPTQRQLRVGEVVRHVLSGILARGDLEDAALSGQIVTIPEVRMSPDLRLATVFVMPLGGENVTEVVKALETHKRVLRLEVARLVNLKFAPDLRFLRDETFQEAARIEAILREEKVQRDIREGTPDLNYQNTLEN